MLMLLLHILQVKVSDVVQKNSAEAAHEILSHIPGVLGVTLDERCDSDAVRSLL